ncbi:hypothetical protein BZARG_3084 [Bizionia argentinensis JUB59]|uniref:Uncharacterized protein n=1 Tax=Bizionia argentinensis JUB59 TaxID=1046627 RepID=G2EFF7_9FLAO|nr:hypothetical protein [Bizionia argentinensis]EGV42831.1 hypothetical protein BZARG_3084 [Bizionia argentinensis JUB59]
MKIKKVTFGAKMEALTKNQFMHLSKIKGGDQVPEVVVHLPTRAAPRECDKGYEWNDQLGQCVRVFVEMEAAASMVRF